MKLGDTVTIPCTFRRKWWQFWKPRTWTVQRTFTVTEVSPREVVTVPSDEELPVICEMLRVARESAE